MAYSIADKQDTASVLDTLQQLPNRSGMMLHRAAYIRPKQEAVKGKGITISISRKGTPADYAPIKSFHSTLKSETFYLEGLTYTTTTIVELTVRDFINYYISIRIQTKLNNQFRLIGVIRNYNKQINRMIPFLLSLLSSDIKMVPYGAHTIELTAVDGTGRSLHL